LIEQGSPQDGDKYARTLTWQRLHNVITGLRPDQCCQRLKSAANEVAKFFASNTKEGCIFRQPSFVFDEIVS